MKYTCSDVSTETPDITHKDSFYSVPFKALYDLVKNLKLFIEPICKFLPFLEYFYFHESKLFEKLICMAQRIQNEEKDEMQRLVCIVHHTKSKIERIMIADDVNYGDVSFTFEVPQNERRKEMSILLEFSLLDNSNLLAQIDDISTLFSFEQSIHSLVMVCINHKLQNCLDDQKFMEIKCISDTFKSEDRKFQMQLSKASTYINTIRQTFRNNAVETFTDGDRIPYLELINDLAQSERFLSFVLSNPLLPPVLRLFQDKLQLVIQMKDIEGISTEFIADLLPEFSLFLFDKNICFTCLIDVIFQQENPKHSREQLKLLNNNIEQIDTLFSQIDVSLCLCVMYTLYNILIVYYNINLTGPKNVINYN